MKEQKTFLSSLVVALPEALGYLDVFAHITTVNGKTTNIQAKHFSRGTSCSNQSWPTIYLNDCNKPVVVENDLNTSYFKVNMELHEKMEGEYYFTVVGWKDNEPKFYYTEKRYFYVGQYY